MGLDTFVVLANQYSTESDAIADYESVRKLYTDLGIVDTYDAAVITRQANGKARLSSERRNRPVRVELEGFS
jgi:hypothetical protein